MNKPEPKKAGRPRARASSHKIKPNITIATYLINEAKETAERKGVGFSEWIADAITRQLARDETAGEPEHPFGKQPSSSNLPGAATKRRTM